MNYKRIALQLFDELWGIYAADIEKHANLCRRYPRLCEEWIKNIESNIDADIVVIKNKKKEFGVNCIKELKKKKEYRFPLKK